MSINGSNPDSDSERQDFSVVLDRAEYRPVAQVTLSEGVSLVTNAINRAREQNVQRLLVDTTGVTGFPVPSITDRYYFAREWAAAAYGQMRISFVARPEMIEPDKFAMTVAKNAGLTCEVFACRDEALAWLQNS